MTRLVVAGVSWLLLVPAAGRGQACAEPHYRWSEKVDTTLQTRSPTPVDILEILTGWAPLSFTSKDRCALRVGREDSVFVLVGWVRRLRLHETDGDWHIELTDAAATPVNSCIIRDSGGALRRGLQPGPRRARCPRGHHAAESPRRSRSAGAGPDHRCRLLRRFPSAASPEPTRPLQLFVASAVGASSSLWSETRPGLALSW